MRHQKTGRALSRSPAHRKAMLRSMVTSLFEHNRIRTTDAKAKEARLLAERMITFAKRGDLHARRQVLRVVRDVAVVERLFSTIAPALADRNGGYTRILKLGRRRGDAAALSVLELVSAPEAEKVEEEEEKGKKAKKKKETAGEAEPPAGEKKKAKRRVKKAVLGAGEKA